MRPIATLVLGMGLAALPAVGAPPTDADMLAPFPHPKGYVCHRATSPITIDGDLADAEWAAAPWTDAFVDIEGDKKPKPRFRTRVKMLWDDEALYIAAELEEPHVWATLTEHDAVIFHDNDFEVFLDPDGDNHLYGELELNALNTTWDLLLDEALQGRRQGRERVGDHRAQDRGQDRTGRSTTRATPTPAGRSRSRGRGRG